MSNWEGVDEAGEHRTVGTHRAWCHECHEWCYPNHVGWCRCCHYAKGEVELWVKGYEADEIQQAIDEARNEKNTEQS